MPKILDDLYYGEIAPWETSVYTNAEYVALRNKKIKEETALMETLNSEQKKLFHTVLETACALSGVTDKESFEEGFKLGLRLGAAVFPI